MSLRLLVCGFSLGGCWDLDGAHEASVRKSERWIVVTPTAIQIEPYASHVGAILFVCPSFDTLGCDHEF